jgi:hypothetical protein
MRLAGGRVRAVSLRGLRLRPAGSVFLQGSGAVPELRRAPDGRAGRASRGPCPARCSRASVGAERTVARDTPMARRYHAEFHGYSLHAGLVVPSGQRQRLERACRYVLRPPVAADRIALTNDGQVRLRLRKPWRDGTTGFVFDPVDFLGRLAVLVPRPRVNLILYYGVLGARSAWRPGATAVGRTAPDAGRCPAPVAGRGPWCTRLARSAGLRVRHVMRDSGAARPEVCPLDAAKGSPRSRERRAGRRGLICRDHSANLLGVREGPGSENRPLCRTDRANASYTLSSCYLVSICRMLHEG